MSAGGILKINKKLLLLAGILDCKYMWYPILVYSLYIPVMISQLFALYQYWGYLDAVVETIIMIVCYILCYGQAAFCFFHRQDIQRIISYIEKKSTELHGKEIQEILKKTKIRSDKMSWFFIITAALHGKEIQEILKKTKIRSNKMSWFFIITAALHGKEIQEILKKTKIRSDKMSWFFIITATVILTSWTMTPFIMYQTQTDEKKHERDPNEPFPYFCLMMVFPFEVTYSPMYELVYLLQASVQAMAAIYCMATLTLINSTTLHTASYFTVLASMLKKLGNPENLILKDIGYDDKYSKHIKTSENSKSIKVISDPEDYLVQCIRQHQDILNFTEELADFLSPLLVIFFRSMEILMCVTVFQVVLTLGKDESVYKYLIAFTASLFFSYSLCSYGEHFKQQSILVEKEVCSSLWYTQSTRFKRHLLMLIMKSQKSVELRVGIFYPMTLETFTKMLNTSYTYFTVLKQLKEE